MKYHLLLATAIIQGLILAPILFAGQENEAIAAILPLDNNSSWLSKPIVAAPNTSTIETDAAASGDNVYLVWEWGDVLFAKSSDGGNTFSSPISMAKRSQVGVTQSPQMVIFQNNIYVVYSSGKDVFLLRSTDSGKTFSSPINVSKMNIKNDPYSVVTEPIISVSDGGNRVYVGWNIWQQMYFAQSADGGLTFGDHTNVSKQGETVFSADIGSANSNVYLVWAAGDENNVYHISFASSNDWGHTFQEIQNISANKSPFSSFEPSVAVGGLDGKTVYLVWRDEVPINPNISNVGAEVAFKKSTDSGNTFDITRYVGSGAWPALTVSGQNIYIASGIQENVSIVFNVGFLESQDGGNTFSEQRILSNQTWAINPRDKPPIPAIASDGANVFVAWRYTTRGSDTIEDYPYHETFLAASYDKGTTFTRQLNISTSKGGDTLSEPFVVAAPVDRVFVFWPEQVIQGNSSKIDLLLVKGQILEEYTQPFRQVSYMPPVEPYSPLITIVTIAALAVGIGVVGTILFLRRKQKIH